MTVTRKVVITFDAPNPKAARAMEAELRYTLIGHPTALARGITGQAFSSEPVAPSPEPLVEPGPRRG